MAACRTNNERGTNIPGVFAVGDVVCSYIQQAVVAASDGAIAAMAAEKYVRGKAEGSLRLGVATRD